VVFIKEAITEEVANNMIALTLYLDSLDNKRIYYWLNVPGGEVRGGSGQDRGAVPC
jgi:ATP-dependent Clp protease protease subunit